MALYYVGLDVHLRTSTLVMLDSGGQRIAQRTLRGHWSHAVAWLRQQGKPLAVCFEASCGYGVLYEQLAAFCRRVVVAHPGHLRLIFRSKRKNDRVDAGKLAMLLLLDQVPQVHVPGLEVRSWRELIEFRRRQVDGRVRVKNQLRALLRSQGMVVPREVRSLWSKKGLAWLGGVRWPTPLVGMRCELLLDQLAQAESAVRKVTAPLDRVGQSHAGVTLLMSMPGVGPRTAEAVAAYIDDPHRFARIGRVGAYFGLVPCQDASAGVNRLGHITKQGPATARKLLIEAAWRCVDRCPAMRGFFDRVVAGKPERRKIALVAVAHKLTRIMLAMLRTGELFDPMRHAQAAATRSMDQEARMTMT